MNFGLDCGMLTSARVAYITVEISWKMCEDVMLAGWFDSMINGLLFDVFHAIGNAFFVVLLANPLGELMSRHRTVNRGVAVSEVATS